MIPHHPAKSLISSWNSTIAKNLSVHTKWPHGQGMTSGTLSRTENSTSWPSLLVPKGKKTRISSCFSTIFLPVTVCSLTKSPHCNLKLLPQNSHYVPENFKLLTLGNYFHFHVENPSYLSQNKEILFPPPSKFQTLTTFSNTLLCNNENSKQSFVL